MRPVFLFFARVGALASSRSRVVHLLGDAAGPGVSGSALAVTDAPFKPLPRGRVRGDREAFQERAARDAVRVARGRVVVLPVSCPVREPRS